MLSFLLLTLFILTKAQVFYIIQYMNQYIPFRDSNGRFAVRPRTQSVNIVPGRLYDYRGSVVRAARKCSNGKRHVSFHKQLHGFVDENELRLIGKNKVKSYLRKA